MKTILSGSFAVLQVVGFWKPTAWVSPWLCRLHKLHMIFSILVLYSFVITGIIGLILRHDDTKQVTNDCFILLSVIAVCGKIINIVRNSQIIMKIVKTLQSYPCAPMNDEEKKIQDKFDRFIWLSTFYYLLITEVAAFMVTVGTSFPGIPYGILPYNTYVPWDSSSGFKYWIAYAYQIMSVTLSANVAIAFDTLVPGVMLQLNAKLDILKHRFTNFELLIESQLMRTSKNNKQYNEIKLKMERELVANYTKCHVLILNLANTVNSTFNLIVLFQYSISTIVICISVYNLANIKSSSEFTAITLYLCCMLTEIFIFCAAGNEVTLVSESIGDAIYDMNWINLNPATIKSLIIIMSRTCHPIIFTSGHVITLSLDSFKSLIKVSYSIYNGLQQTS